ncbi:MAG: flagellar assembly protein FliW [Peptostreptococcaceae bacterium]|nr:flagellar assembly protein FliW [Peptostreptococcaceae bacterium]
MEINTRDFGTVQVESDAIYDFPSGLYGFEEATAFAVFAQTHDDISFLYLQSTKTLNPCFLVFEPWDLYTTYAPVISADDLAALEVKTVEDLMFLVIANVPMSIEELSINVKSPIVLNPKTKKARQVILQNPDYPIRYKPFLQDGKDGSSC